MLSKRDYAFLVDYRDFSYLNRFVSALSLFRGGMDSNSIALETHNRLDLLPFPEAQMKADDLGTDINVKIIIQSKIFSEYVASVEDFAALLYAIRHRHKKGIFSGYMNSQKEIYSFLDRQVILNRDADLGEILVLPSVSDLSAVLNDDELAIIRNIYDTYAPEIVSIMDKYRQTVSVSSAPYILPDNWRERIAIVTGIKSDEAKNIPLLSKTFNKIKHRFMVVKSIDKLIQAEPKLEYTVMPKDPEWSKSMLDSIGGIAVRAAEIVAMLIYLDDHGVDIDGTKALHEDT